MTSASSYHRPELMAVMPVYNEQASIRKVVREWFQELDLTLQEFILLIIDDGSNDGTYEILLELQREFGKRIETFSRGNRGHGQTCLQGYREAVLRKIPFVLQIDSDGQCDPRFFQPIWNLRHQFDVIYGKRTREDGIRRILASGVLRTLLRYQCGVKCVDPNVPFRLMRTTGCNAAFQAIPDDFFLANVALAVTLRKMPEVRHGSIPIRFLPRYGGEPSIPLSKFINKAIELIRQLSSVKTPRS